MKFHCRLNPGSIRLVKTLAGSGWCDGLDNVIERPDWHSVRVDVGMADNSINDLLVSLRVVDEATKVRNDEVNISITRHEHLGDMWLQAYIDKYR